MSPTIFCKTRRLAGFLVVNFCAGLKVLLCVDFVRIFTIENRAENAWFLDFMLRG